MARKILLNTGNFAIVDNEDYMLVSKYNWIESSEGYAVRSVKKNGKCGKVRMHRVINKTPYNMLTDHVNGDRLDNRKSNLRSCNAKQNCRNRQTPTNNTSGFKGVSFHNSGRNNYWRSIIRLITKRGGRNLVSKYFPFTDEGKLQAAKWYNEQAKKHFGEFAKLNEV